MGKLGKVFCVLGLAGGITTAVILQDEISAAWGSGTRLVKQAARSALPVDFELSQAEQRAKEVVPDLLAWQEAVRSLQGEVTQLAGSKVWSLADGTNVKDAVESELIGKARARLSDLRQQELARATNGLAKAREELVSLSQQLERIGQQIRQSDGIHPAETHARQETYEKVTAWVRSAEQVRLGGKTSGQVEVTTARRD